MRQGFLVIAKHRQQYSYLLRIIFFAKDESLLSDTFEIFEEINLGEISRNIQGLLIDVKAKMNKGGYDDFLSDEDKKKVIIGLDDIKSKFKRVYSSED